MITKRFVVRCNNCNTIRKPIQGAVTGTLFWKCPRCSSNYSYSEIAHLGRQSYTYQPYDIHIHHVMLEAKTC